MRPGAINGHVAAGVRDPVQAMQLRAMELPDGERSFALEALARRLADVGSALDAELAAGIRTAFLAGWADSHWHEREIAAREAREAMGDGITGRAGGRAR